MAAVWQFLSYILQMSQWKLEAELKLNQKLVNLKIDSKKKINSHYKDLSGYLPEDLQALLDNLNQSKALEDLGWKALPSEDFLNLGKQEYCFQILASFIKQVKNGILRFFTDGINLSLYSA